MVATIPDFNELKAKSLDLLIMKALFKGFQASALLLALAGAAVAALDYQPDKAEGGNIILPQGLRVYAPGPAPAFRLDDMDGESFSLSETRGRWVFIHFWASWCGPCRKEMPAVQRMAEVLQDEQLVIVR